MKSELNQTFAVADASKIKPDKWSHKWYHEIFCNNVIIFVSDVTSALLGPLWWESTSHRWFLVTTIILLLHLCNCLLLFFPNTSFPSCFFFPVTFFPVLCYFFSCYFFSCFFLSSYFYSCFFFSDFYCYFFSCNFFSCNIFSCFFFYVSFFPVTLFPITWTWK